MMARDLFLNPIPDRAPILDADNQWDEDPEMIAQHELKMWEREGIDEAERIEEWFAQHPELDS